MTINSLVYDQPATLLLVDDEPNVLKSLQRVLRRSNCRLLLAENALDALALLEQNTVDLIISDARMPGMDGASLLSKVRARWPECMRILLTGYPDVETTVKAVNDGEIYRYVAKPWNDAELRLVVEQSLAFLFAERERDRLQRLAEEKNRELQALTATLEERVRQRTAKLEAATRMLEEAHAELEQSFVTATEMFSSLIHKRLPKSRRTNQEVVGWIRAYCHAHETTGQAARDLAMAGALYNLGKLTWRDDLIALAMEQLNRDDRERYNQYPEIGEDLLMALEPAKGAALLIRHHQERWDGAGLPDGISGESIPWGARLLKLVVDFVELQKGMRVPRQMSIEEALDLISVNAGRVYDPELAEQFIALVRETEQQRENSDPSIIELGTLALEPDMVLAQPLYTEDGVLMLNEGSVLTERLIERLRQFERSGAAAFTLQIRQSSQDEAAC